MGNPRSVLIGRPTSRQRFVFGQSTTYRAKEEWHKNGAALAKAPSWLVGQFRRLRLETDLAFVTESSALDGQSDVDGKENEEEKEKENKKKPTAPPSCPFFGCFSLVFFSFAFFLFFVFLFVFFLDDRETWRGAPIDCVGLGFRVRGIGQMDGPTPALERRGLVRQMTQKKRRKQPHDRKMGRKRARKKARKGSDKKKRKKNNVKSHSKTHHGNAKKLWTSEPVRRLNIRN